MRGVLLILSIALAAPAAQANIITYDINANFGVRQTSPGGVVQPAGPGGLLAGFVSFDTAQTDDAAIVDFDLSSELPNFLGNSIFDSRYQFSDPNDTFSFDSGTGVLSLQNDVIAFSALGNRDVISQRTRLTLTIDALGDADALFTGSESFSLCSNGFGFTGFFNVCDRPQGSNSQLSTLASIRGVGGGSTGGGQTGGGSTGGSTGGNTGGGTGGSTGGGQTGSGTVAIPEPGSLALILTGLLGLAGMRRRA